MARGRKAKPAALKRLQGNPGKRKLHVDRAPMAKGVHAPGARDVATFAVPPPPAWLSKLAKNEWRRLASDMVQLGLLRRLDTTDFAVRCEQYATLRACQAVIAKEGRTYTVNGVIRLRPEARLAQDCAKQIRSFDSDFGINPAARARVAHVTGDRGVPPQPTLPLNVPAAAPAAASPPQDTGEPSGPAKGPGPDVTKLTDDEFFGARRPN